MHPGSKQWRAGSEPAGCRRLYPACPVLLAIGRSCNEVCSKTYIMIHRGFLQIAFLSLLVASCSGQTKERAQPRQPGRDSRQQPVGGAFENREFIYQGMPEEISPADTSPGWAQQGQKMLITGVVYRQDGQTPAPGVILYYYHTNTEGSYVHKPEEKQSMPPNGYGQTHGYIRGWVRTDAAGRYSVYTVRPGIYPSRDEPAHIHVAIKEPGDINEYYIDDFVFDGDELLTSDRRKRMKNRGGSGILSVFMKDDLYIGERDIILGLNIPGYPAEAPGGR